MKNLLVISLTILCLTACDFNSKPKTDGVIAQPFDSKNFEEKHNDKVDKTEKTDGVIEQPF